MARFTDYELAAYRRKHGEPGLPLPPKPRKATRNTEESQHQCGLVRWWSHKCRELGVSESLLFSVPNGGWRSKIGASILKREGQRNGVSDLFLAMPFNGKSGLFVEMKAKGGVVSDEQEAFIATVLAQGYAACVCWNYDEAVKAISDYLEGKL